MGKSTKPRKKYVPGVKVPVRRNGIEFLRSGYVKLSPREITELLAKARSVMLVIQAGHGEREHWKVLSGTINLATVLCELELGYDQIGIMRAAQQAMLQLKERHLRTGRMVFTGDELRQIDLAIELHEAQLEVARTIDIERAYDIVQQRLRHPSMRTQLEAPAVAGA